MQMYNNWNYAGHKQLNPYQLYCTNNLSHSSRVVRYIEIKSTEQRLNTSPTQCFVQQILYTNAHIRYTQRNCAAPIIYPTLHINARILETRDQRGKSNSAQQYFCSNYYASARTCLWQLYTIHPDIYCRLPKPRSKTLSLCSKKVVSLQTASTKYSTLLHKIRGILHMASTSGRGV